MKSYFLLLIWLGGCNFAFAQNLNLSPYNLFPQGSARAMAMGGAYTALSRNGAGMYYNPAGLAFGSWTFDLASTQNRTTNTETNRIEGGSDDSTASDFSNTVGALRWEGWVVAAGVSSPYQLTLESLEKVGELSVESYDILLARRIHKHVSVGVSYHLATLSSRYSDPFNSIDLSENSSSTGFRIGLAMIGKRGGLGLSYSSSQTFAVDQQSNAQIADRDWFYNARIPQKFTLGLYRHLSPQLILAIDFDYIDAPENAIHPSLSREHFTVDDKSKNIVHGGLEWQVVDTRSTEFLIRLGTYSEPTRLSGGPARMHTTYGVEVRLGPVILTVSFDKAEQFNNTAQGFSVALGEI